MDSESVADRRLAAAPHGCCCVWFKLIWELYLALAIDAVILVAGLPALFDEKTPTPMLIWMAFYLFAIVVPSMGLFINAIWNSKESGAPRLLLVRFLVFWKVPAFLFCYCTFFCPLINPWANEVILFMCDPANNFEHGKISRIFERNGKVDVPACVKWVPWLMIPGIAGRLCIYLYSVKGAIEYMRCHPDNDGKGIVSNNGQAKDAVGEYGSMKD